MAEPAVLRRLTAIVMLDAVGYSRRMGEDAAGALAALKGCGNDVIVPVVARHRGRIVKQMGDGWLIEYASAVDAVRCAVAIQDEIRRRNLALSAERRLEFRVGVSLGEVMVEGDDLFGQGVNIAARLQALAEPGSIRLSADVYHQVKRQVDCSFEDLGERRMKNIAEPVHVYGVRTGGAASEADRAAAELASAPIVTGLPAIVVLPFDNLSEDASQEYFCDGLTQSLTTDLSRFRNLFVIAAHSAFVYKNRPAKVQEIARALGVRYLLEGSVQRDPRKVRINVQLIDGSTGRHLWAERFDGELADLFAVQDEVVQRIVATLAVKVDAAERERALRKSPANLSAYDLYLRGEHAYSHETAAALLHCRGLFEQATKTDPGFARAWGYLAYTTARGVMQGWMRHAALVEAEAFARRAVALDPDDYANHWDLAFVHLRNSRFDLARIEFDKAMALNPNDADLLADMAVMHVQVGEAEEAIRLLQKAMRINPHFPDWYRWNLGWARFNARQYAEAAAELERLADPPTNARLMKAAAYWYLGERERAQVAFAEYRSHAPEATLGRLRAHTAFRRPEDESHWMEAVSALGLPE